VADAVAAVVPTRLAAITAATPTDSGRGIARVGAFRNSCAMKPSFVVTRTTSFEVEAGATRVATARCALDSVHRVRPDDLMPWRRAFVRSPP
jgi:hypothetical protein